MITSHQDSPGIIAPPPALYASAFALGWLLDSLWPIRLFPTAFETQVLGVAIFSLGLALATWSFLTLRRFGTSPNPYKPTAAISTDGPFRFTRNPIYLAMTNMYLGAAIFSNWAWTLPMLVPLWAVMTWGVILREERYLAAKFGNRYLDYRARVRRWL